MLKWRRNSQSSQKPVPISNDVQRILDSLHEALGENNPIYVILMQRIDTQEALEAKCTAIYEGISDLLLTPELMTSDVSKNIQSLKKDLENLNFTRTKDKKRENIFSGYLLRQQLEQFFNQHQNEFQTFSRNTQILITSLQNFLKEDNDQLIKSMMVLIDSVTTKEDKKILKSSKFPVYTFCQNEFPGACNKLDLFEEVFAEIKMNMVDNDVGQLFDYVNKLQIDDSARFQIVKGILNYLGNQYCGETYVQFIDLLLGSDNVVNALKKVNEFKDALSETVRALNQQFDTIMIAISGNLESVRTNLSIVSGYNLKVEELNDTFEEFKYEKDVMAREDNGSSMRSIKQLSLEKSKMETMIPRVSELQESVDAVLEEVVSKVAKRDKQLEIIMQMNLSAKGRQLEEFKSELENLSQQADIGKLEKQIDELLAEPAHKKYLKSDEKLCEMNCDDVESDISSLQEFKTNFEDVEQLKKAIELKQELGQKIQQVECLCNQSKFILDKLEKVQQGLVAFIVNKLEQIKGNMEKYKDDSTPIKKNESYNPNVWKAYEQKLEKMDYVNCPMLLKNTIK
jgi:hypothetical protein